MWCLRFNGVRYPTISYISKDLSNPTFKTTLSSGAIDSKNRSQIIHFAYVMQFILFVHKSGSYFYVTILIWAFSIVLITLQLNMLKSGE